MKRIYKLLNTVLVASLLTLMCAGCNNVWTGSKNGISTTKANFTDKEQELTAPLDSGARSAQVVSIPDYIEKASDDTRLEVKISSYTKLDEDTINDAVTFWALGENKDYSSGAPERTEKLTSKIIDITKAVSSNMIETTIEFSVDTSNVVKNYIAIMLDATLLKDKNGAFVINGNDNEECGEATDSFIYYIKIYKNAADETPEVINFVIPEVFAPSYFYKTELYSEYDAINNEYKFTISAQYYDFKVLEYKDKDDFAEELNKLYKIQIKAPDSSSYTDQPLNFAYVADDHEYKATFITEPGTYYRRVDYIPSFENALSETEQSTIRFGHPSYSSYKKNPKTSYGTEEIWDIYKQSPTYIVSALAFVDNTKYSYTAISAAQRGLFTVTRINSGVNKYTIKLGELASQQLEFNTYEDFIVTDENYNRIPAKVTKTDDSTVQLTLDNEYYKKAIQIWVGKGVTVKENPVNAAQVSFGIYDDIKYGSASGYIKIYN